MILCSPATNRIARLRVFFASRDDLRYLTDGTRALVVYNPGDAPVTYRVLIDDGGVELTIPAESMHSCVFAPAESPA